MEPLARVNDDFQLPTKEDRDNFERQSREEGLCIGNSSICTCASDELSPTLRWRSWEMPPTLDSRTSENPSAMWNYSFRSETPPALPAPGFDQFFARDIMSAPTKSDFKPSSTSSRISENDLEKHTDSFYSSTDVAENLLKNKNPPNIQGKMSVMIFQSSATIPITIIVTAPLEEAYEPMANLPVQDRNAMCFLAAMPDSYHFSTVNSTLLMPPRDKQLCKPSLRNSQDLSEIRRWLVTFLNSKGDRLPRKLRLRMMDIYCIREIDLDPKTVAKFYAEAQDGVAWGQQADEMDEAENLRILRAALRSQVDGPSKKKIIPLPGPQSWQQQRNKPKELEIRSSKGTGAKLKSHSATEIKEYLDKDVRGHLFSTTSTSFGQSMLPTQSRHKKAHLKPTLQPSRTRVNTRDSAFSVPEIRKQSSEISGIDAPGKKYREKPGSLVSGAFGAIRDALTKISSKQKSQ